MFEILIVDDRKEFRTLFKSLIKTADFNADVSEAEGVESALVTLGQKKFDCVILDYILGDSIGLDVLRPIKSVYPDLPALMISAYDKGSIGKEVLTAGADAFLSKDELSPEKLTQTLVKILSKKGSDPDAFAFEGLEGMKVLLVDDTPQNLDVLRKTLDHTGLNISVAPNGKVALKLVSTDPPDLILLDIMMPVMDGFETCRKLKGNDHWKNIPVIFITALTREEDFTKGFSLGAVDYISKPFRSEEILARVNTHLQTRKLLKAKDLLINQIAKKEIHLSTLMDSMLDGLIVIGRDQVIRSFNPAAEKIFGHSSFDVIGKNFENLISSANSKELQNYFEGHPGSNNSHVRGKNFEVEGVDKSGNKIPLELAISKINFSPEGNSQEIKFEQLFVALVRDISQRIESEKQIIYARETAEKANKAKSEFLAKMSHELRTPLNSIMGFSQLLIMDPDLSKNIEPTESATRIYKSGKHLLELINEILDLARIEAGRIKFSMESVELSSLMEELLALNQPIANEHHVRLINEATEPVYCQTDRSRLKQVLLNLISNAIKYNTENGTVAFSIKKDGKKLRINVADTGPGISEEMQASLFQPFNRLDADKTGIIGTGIGLTIAKELIELMGGTIGLKSTVGKGSTFYIELDVLETPTEKKAPVAGLSKPEIPPQKAGKKYTILYVEDNPDNLKLMEQVLNINGNFDLISAPQAEMGIDLAKTFDVDLILMDINLPGMDGITAMKALKRIEKTRNLPIVAVSANALEKDIKSCLNAGFTDYIVKPINIPQFLKKIDAILT